MRSNRGADGLVGLSRWAGQVAAVAVGSRCVRGLQRAGALVGDRNKRSRLTVAPVRGVQRGDG